MTRGCDDENQDASSEEDEYQGGFHLGMDVATPRLRVGLLELGNLPIYYNVASYTL